MRAVIADAHRTRPVLTIALAVVDHAVAWLALGGASWIWLHDPVPLGMIAGLLAMLVVARQLRALECLVHESSHFNWSRGHRGLNDLLALILAGLPTGARIEDYRSSHLLHHGRFGTEQDPDRQRYRELQLESLQQQGRLRAGLSLIAVLPQYQAGWVQSLRSRPGYLALPLMWTALPAGAVGLWLGPAGFAVAAVLWFAGFLLVLPMIRLLGEASEHLYTDSDTVFDATISNLGLLQRLLVHPHNDGYHTVHHMWPGVPHHALRRLHEALVRHDPGGYGCRLRSRTRVLSAPRRGLPGLAGAVHTSAGTPT